jgi:hypothetical protein
MPPLEISSAEEILKEIMEGYNASPKGWQIALDLRGNSLVLGPKDGYALKAMMIGPGENLGIGARIDHPDELRKQIGGGFSCGLRPVGEDLAKELLAALSGGGRQDQLSAAFGRLMSREPVPTWELGEGRQAAVVGGPFVSHVDLKDISRSQRELEAKLATELDGLFRSKYPMRASMFR